MNNRFFLILSFASIILLASFSRFWRLTQIPPSLFSDEVDAGYQAMIFTQNGTDYFAHPNPVHFQSFSDWRTSAYIYSISFLNKININPELAVRLPSAIFGIIGVYLIYLITKSTLASLLMAISPWAIHYSRSGFEVSGMLFTILLGIYLFQKYIHQKTTIYLYLSIIFFCLSPYFYSTAKIFLPLILLLIIIIWRKLLLNLKPVNLIIIGLIFFCMLTPLAVDTLQGKSGFRFSYIGIFTQPHREQITDNLRYQDARVDHPDEIGVKTTLISKIFHNKIQLVIQRFINNYVSSFSTDFLLIRGDENTRHGFGGFGLIYILDIIFISIGLFATFLPKVKNKLSLLFFWILVLSPIPYSLTRDADSPHATRLILMLPSLIYFSYLGINYLFSKYKILKLPILLFYLFSFISFFHYYKYHYPQETARQWHYGMKDSVLAITPYSDKTIVFSNKYEPFLPFFLFYYPYSLTPDTSISNHLKPISNFSFDGQLLDSQYYFGNINWTNLSYFNSDTIYIVPKSEYANLSLNNPNIIRTIDKKYINQEEFIIFSLK